MRVRRRHGIIRTNTIDRARYSPDSDGPGDQPIGQQACSASLSSSQRRATIGSLRDLV